MSAHTKMHPTENSSSKEKTIPWREVFKEEIEKYTEAGAALRGCRYREDMTQKQLADLLGIKHHHISEMEHGKRPISKKMALRLGEIFKVNYRIFL